jgi:hypothetical protein
MGPRPRPTGIVPVPVTGSTSTGADAGTILAVKQDAIKSEKIILNSKFNRIIMCEVRMKTIWKPNIHT